MSGATNSSDGCWPAFWPEQPARCYILYKGYIGPTTMSAFAGAGVLMMVLLGGMGTLWGPIVGAGIFIYIQDYISTMTRALGNLPRSRRDFSGFVHADGICRSRQLFQTAAKGLIQYHGMRFYAPIICVDISVVSRQRIACASNLKKAGCDPLSVPMAPVKPRLSTSLPAEYRPAPGKCYFQGAEITNKPTHELVKMGICRTFQITSIFNNLTVFENVRIAKQASSGGSLRIFSTKKSLKKVA